MCSPSSRSGSTERGTVLHLGVPKCTKSSDGARTIYFSNTFSICPIFFSTLPAFFSALPSACK